MTDAAVRTDQKAGWCAQCRGGGHDLCVSVKCTCPKRGHSLRRATAPKATVTPIRPAATPQEQGDIEVSVASLDALMSAGCHNCKAGNHDACLRRNCGCLAALEALVQAHGVHTVRRGREPEPLPQNRERHARVRPTSTTKVCPRCKQEKPIAAFYIQNKATGATQSYCKDCNRDYSRERYISVSQVAVSIEVLAGDDCIGETCPRCSKPFQVGETVVGDQLHHEGCE